MAAIPVVRHLLACKKEPTMNGPDPSVHEILYSVRPKGNFSYPVWHQPFYLFAMIADGQGLCRFHVEVRLVEWDGIELETLIGRSKHDLADLGNEPLRIRFLTLLVPPVLLSQTGVYRIYLICNGEEIGSETIHAR